MNFIGALSVSALVPFSNLVPLWVEIIWFVINLSRESWDVTLFKKIFLLKDNCFTEFCCFLSNLNMNQPQAYIYPLPFEPPSHLPPHPTPLGWHRAPVKFPETYRKFPLTLYFTHGDVSVHVTFCTSHPLLSIIVFCSLKCWSWKNSHKCIMLFFKI